MKRSKLWRNVAASLAVMFVIGGCASSGETKAANAGERVRVIQNQKDLDAVTGYDSAAGKWSSGAITLFSKNIKDWKAADSGAKVDGLVIAKGADVKLFLPGELIPQNPGMSASDANTFYLPAGKFLKVESGAKFQLRSGLSDDDYDNITLIVGGAGTSNPAVSVESGNDADSILNAAYPYAIEIAEGGLFTLGSDNPTAIDKTGGKSDNAVLILADGKSLGSNGKPSNYAAFIKVDGEFRVACAGGAGVAKIWTIDNLTANGTTMTGKGKLFIHGRNPEQGNAIFAINLFDRGEYSNGMERIDVPEISLGTIEIVGEGVVGIYNPDGTVDGSPGYRNNANAGFYYVGGDGKIKADKMIVKSTNPGVTADTTVALANFNTAAGILGGVVTDHGPTVELGEVEVYCAAEDNKDGPLSAIYTVQGVITATVTGGVKVESGAGAAAIVATGHGRWTGPEKTKSTMGSVTVTSSGKNAFFQNNTFDGYGTHVLGDLVVSANYDGTITSFVGAVSPGPDMGKGGTLGQAPEAEDVRSEQFVNQGGEVKIDGNVTITNTNAAYYSLFRNDATTSVGSLSINGEKLTAASAPATDAIRVEGSGTLTIAK